MAGDGDPRDRFVDERRRFRKGEREERNGPRIFCCCVFGSREEVVAAPLTLRKEDEVDGACDELVIGLPSSPVSADGVVAGEVAAGAGKPAEVFGRVSGGAGFCAIEVSVRFSEASPSALAAAAAAAVFLWRRKREKRSIVAVNVADYLEVSAQGPGHDGNRTRKGSQAKSSLFPRRRKN